MFGTGLAPLAQHLTRASVPKPSCRMRELDPQQLSCSDVRPLGPAPDPTHLGLGLQLRGGGPQDELLGDAAVEDLVGVL
jgi:hypothetical protein